MDLIIRNARLTAAGPGDPLVDIGVDGGRIVAVQPKLQAEGPVHDAGGHLVSPGLVESHFHLDKALIVDRVPMQPDRMKRDHMERTASIKHTFTAEDIYDRARRTLEQSLLHGVTLMRTQVEVDPNVGLLGFEAVSALGERLIGRPALGLGDAKLAGLMGAWLGPTGLAVAVALAVITGAFFGAGGRISGLLGRHQPFPFGPFLIAGTLTVWISGPGIWLGLYRWASGS